MLVLLWLLAMLMLPLLVVLPVGAAIRTATSISGGNSDDRALSTRTIYLRRRSIHHPKIVKGRRTAKIRSVALTVAAVTAHALMLLLLLVLLRGASRGGQTTSKFHGGDE